MSSTCPHNMVNFGLLVLSVLSIAGPLFRVEHFTQIYKGEHTDVVAAASSVNPSLPPSFKQTPFPLVLIWIVIVVFSGYCEGVRTEVTDLQALEVAHKVVEGHPAISNHNENRVTWILHGQENRKFRCLKTQNVNSLMFENRLQTAIWFSIHILKFILSAWSRMKNITICYKLYYAINN